MIVPTVGAAGAVGTALITTFALAAEVHPVDVSVTVKLCVVDTARPVKVVVVPLPAIAPGLIVQVPAGKPLNSTLPVGTVQVGCVIVPTVGAAGAAGLVNVIGPAIELAETQPENVAEISV